MARTNTLGNFLTDVAEAIRTKEGTTGAIAASEFDTRISNLSGGGSENLTEELTTYGAELEEQNVTLSDIVKALNGKGTGSGGVAINVFAQETEPETKDGIWLQTDKTYENVAFTSILTEWESNTSRTSIPFSFKAGGGGKVGDYVYLFGGSGSTTSAYKYSISNDTYTKLANVPSGKSYTPTKLVGKNIYMSGLYNNTMFQKFDTTTETYTTLANSPTALSGATFVNVGDYLYAFGRDDGTNGKRIFKYSITNNSWEELSVLAPYQYAYPHPFAIGTKIYLVSMRVGGSPVTVASENYVFDTVTETFTKLNSTPPSGFIAGGVYVDSECVYLFGGENGDTNSYKYFPATDTYVQLTGQKHSVTHSNVIIKNGDEFIAFGGQYYSTTVLSMYMNDTNPTVYTGDAIVIYTNSGTTSTNKSFELFDLGDLFLNYKYNTIYFDDVAYRYVTGEFDNTIPTYYGDGTQWIKFKN